MLVRGEIFAEKCGREGEGKNIGKSLVRKM